MEGFNMKGIINIANFISDNYITILALILIIVGIVVKVKKFFSPDGEAQQEQLKPLWGYGSVGRASRSQCEGQGFESPYLHQ